MNTRRKLSVATNDGLDTEKSMKNLKMPKSQKPPVVSSGKENKGSKKVSGKTSISKKTSVSTQVLKEATLNIENKNAGKSVTKKNLKALATAESQASTENSTAKGTLKSKRRISESSTSYEEVLKEDMILEKRKVSKHASASKTPESETSGLLVKEPISKNILKRRITTDIKPEEQKLTLPNRCMTRNQHKILENKIKVDKMNKTKSTKDGYSPNKTETEKKSVYKIGKNRITKFEGRTQPPFKLASEKESAVSSTFKKKESAVSYTCKKKGPKSRTSKLNDLSNKTDDDTESVASEKSIISVLSSRASLARSSKIRKSDLENATSSFDSTSRKKRTKLDNRLLKKLKKKMIC